MSNRTETLSPYVLTRICRWTDTRNVLCDRDGGRPLLFATREAAEDYFRRNSKGATMADLGARVERATMADLAQAEAAE